MYLLIFMLILYNDISATTAFNFDAACNLTLLIVVGIDIYYNLHA